MLTRRRFVACSGATLWSAGKLQAQALSAAPTTRPNIGVIDRDRILRAAATPPLRPKEGDDAESAAFLAFSLSLPALAAAVHIDAANAERYQTAAAAQLDAWFINPETRLPSSPEFKAFEPILQLVPLGELCVALPFLGIGEDQIAGVKTWFLHYLTWLTESRTALLARDAKDHHGSSWLLQVSAAARLTGHEVIAGECRHRFKTSTVRAQIDSAGLFPHELTTPNPYRNSLFNLDLLAGVCMLLSTQFESLWDHELQDGPGMRSAVARHAFYIRDRVKWPYAADATHFKLLPGRRPALVFAGRAYADAEYVTLWRTLDPDPTDGEIARTFPIRQPLLWLSQPRRSSV